MKVITGTVVKNRVQLPPESLDEGEHVMVLAPETSEVVPLTTREEEELLSALEEIRRGEYVDGTELLEEVRSRSRRT